MAPYSNEGTAVKFVLMALQLCSFPTGIYIQMPIKYHKYAKCEGPAQGDNIVHASSAVPNVGYMQAGQKRTAIQKSPKEKPKW